MRKGKSLEAQKALKSLLQAKKAIDWFNALPHNNRVALVTTIYNNKKLRDCIEQDIRTEVTQKEGSSLDKLFKNEAD